MGRPYPLVRDAVHAGITAAQRRMLHARAATMVSEPASWEHRVAALDHPDEGLAALDQLRADSGQVSYLRPALAWLEGWLAEQRGDLDEARRIYAGGEAGASTGSPVYAGRLLLAHGRLLRRTGNRKEAVERLRRANSLFGGLRAAPFVARVEAELAACHLPANPAKKRSALALTDG